jgi:negative elongation factor B
MNHLEHVCNKAPFQELREKLISQINEIGKKEGKERDKKLKELLAKSFPVIKVKSLRPMVMCILSNTPQIDEKYLKVLVGCSETKYLFSFK